MTQSVHGLISYVNAGMKVCIVPPLLKKNRWHTVTRVVSAKTGQLVLFDDIQSISDAQELVGKMILAYEDDLPSSFDLNNSDSCIGQTVVDAHYGELGTITAIMEGPQQIWVVEGSYGEVLIPVVDEFINNVDPVGAISVSLPHGLIEGVD